MYAVIETGGKQYRVELGSELAVERLDAIPGATINLDRVLLVADGTDAQIGTPTVADAMVTADVLRQDRGEKVIVFKYRPKARHRAKKGHRQEQTVLRIADIRFNGRSAAEEAGTKQAEQAGTRKQAKAEAERKAAADQALAAKLEAHADATRAAAAETATAEKTSTKPKKSTPRAAKAKAADASAAAADKPATKPAKPSAAKPSASKATAAKATAAKPAAAPKKTSAPAAKTTAARKPRTSTKKDD